jgi:hypothetical protein
MLTLIRALIGTLSYYTSYYIVWYARRTGHDRAAPDREPGPRVRASAQLSPLCSVSRRYVLC